MVTVKGYFAAMADHDNGSGRPKVLFICGTINQTTQMHKIYRELPEVDSYFTPYYGDHLIDWARRRNLLEFSILGNKIGHRSLQYLVRHGLKIDQHGRRNSYDLVVTCADLIIPKNIRHLPIILVQEGMTDPEGFWYHAVKYIPGVPRWLASTAAMGLSGAYDRFCVASPGYRDLFIRKGIDREKIVVTGIPNFDDCDRFRNNTFPHRGFALLCTSDSRETFQWENRRRTIERALEIAGHRKLIVKLHPNERVEYATAEIRRYAPQALVFAEGNTEEMIANCDVLITRFSSTVYVGLALGKEVYSSFDIDELRRLMPIQGGSASMNIARVCRDILLGTGRVPAGEYVQDRVATV